MQPKYFFWHRLCGAVVLIWVFGLSSTQASVLPVKLKELRNRADLYERQADWDKACEVYENILKLHRDLPEIRERYQHCLRRYRQVRRLRDDSYRKEVLSLEYAQAMRLYGIVVKAIRDNGLDKKKIAPGLLFRKGIDELRWALSDADFRQAFLPTARPADIQAFLTFLTKTWSSLPIATRAEAAKQVREVALAASAMLDLNTTTVIMEFACGACYALDDYTTYLTPTQLRELCDSLKGEFVGVGLTLTTKDNKLVIADITAGTPAAEIMPPLAKGDQIISIDRRAADQFLAETAQDMLEGPAGTTVELLIQSVVMGPRKLVLRRRAMFIPSVAVPRMLNETTGYLHIAAFQDSTLQELDAALLQLTNSHMKALVLDLRGNGGGIFEVAIEAAKRFLPNGVIVSTQNYDPKYNTIYQSRNSAALTVPLVVLIDQDTASAAEVLAGAIKDNKRGRLVGQTTFGKGCTQSVFKLPAAPGGVPTGGLRITVAQFFSPSGLPYTGRGVVPHVFADRFLMPDSMNDVDNQLEEARLEAQRLLANPDR